MSLISSVVIDSDSLDFCHEFVVDYVSGLRRVFRCSVFQLPDSVLNFILRSKFFGYYGYCSWNDERRIKFHA